MSPCNDYRTPCIRQLLVVVAVGLGLLVVASESSAQNNPRLENRERLGPVPIESSEIEALMNEESPSEPTDPSVLTGIDLLTLVTRGGAFMLPIAAMSLLVVALSFERLLTLRKQKIIPKLLVRDLETLTHPVNQFDPKHAYESCVAQPSPASRVVISMLLRTGQPMADIERAATETIDREADRLSSPIRWLSFAAAATPLMGLLGTVWGMIVAFHESTTLTADRSRSEQLSEGIYTALVTTLAGLIVAIPAAMLALYLENRLAKLFHQLEQLAFDVAPAIAQFAGRKRMDAQGNLHPVETPVPPPVDETAAPPLPPPTTATGSGTVTESGQVKRKKRGSSKQAS